MSELTQMHTQLFPAVEVMLQDFKEDTLITPDRLCARYGIDAEKVVFVKEGQVIQREEQFDLRHKNWVCIPRMAGG